MNNPQNMPQRNFLTALPPALKWGGLAAVIVILIICGLMLMSSSEKPVAFLSKWKSALESGELKKYKALWIGSARKQADAGYTPTAQLLQDKYRIEVDIRYAEDNIRKNFRDPNQLQIEGIPTLVYIPGEPRLQSRNLTIQKKGLIQQRWKLLRDEVVSEELAPPGTTFESETPTETQTADVSQPDSPVAPLVLEWKKALEAQDEKRYTDLWDKSARKKQKSNFQLALAQVSQEAQVDLTQAIYSKVPRSKNRYTVDNINVTLSSDGMVIDSHTRTLTIEKKGFFRRNWKLINDELGTSISQLQNVPQDEQPGADTVSGESSAGTFDGNAPIDTQLKVRQILEKWRRAWEDKELETYMSIYADRAQVTRVNVRDGKKQSSVNLTKKQLRAKMQKLNNVYGKIDVTISNLQINGDTAVADAEFIQTFKGTPASGTRPAYNDIGTKKLMLMIDPADGYWRIFSETWQRYEDVPDYPRM